MKVLIRDCFFLIVLLILQSCTSGLRVYDISQVNHAGIYRIVCDIDLDGNTFFLPKNTKLIFGENIISNGTLVGDETEIKYKKHCFKDIKIQGTWRVPVIKSSIFTEYGDDDLINLFNLQSNHILNEIYVAPGNYVVSSNNRRAGITLTSNTNLHLDGTLRLEPQKNNQFYNGYYLMSIAGVSNVSISGNGMLVGDIDKSEIISEYGHGLCIYESKNISVSGIKIKDVHGDGIVVSKHNHKISLHDISIDNYFRNGISVTDGSNISINDIIVSHGGKTEPYAAIDVEPNEGDHVSDVVIGNIIIKDCMVGIAGYAPKNASVDRISYNNVFMEGISRLCLGSSQFNSLSMTNIHVSDVNKDASVMRFIGNKHLILEKIEVNTPNNEVKYPFYINNNNTEITNSVFICPQLFTYHLSNASFRNNSFRFKSFIWTSEDIANMNLSFDQCVFDGPLYMRPENVQFRNSVFKDTSGDNVTFVTFEEKRGFKDSARGVTWENNEIEINDTSLCDRAMRCMVRNSLITRTLYRH